MFQPTAINITTLLMVAITVWLIYNRQRGRLDSNWPLFYYVALVMFSWRFRDVLHPSMVFIGVVAGLLLRFEFMGGPILIAVRTVELICLGYYIWVCLGIVFGW